MFYVLKYFKELERSDFYFNIGKDLWLDVFPFIVIINKTFNIHRFPI